MKKVKQCTSSENHRYQTILDTYGDFGPGTAYCERHCRTIGTPDPVYGYTCPLCISEKRTGNRTVLL